MRQLMIAVIGPAMVCAVMHQASALSPCTWCQTQLSFGLPKSAGTAGWNEMRAKLEQAARDWNGRSEILER